MLHNSLKNKALTLCLIAAFAFTGSAFADSGKWIHIKVKDGGDENVTINLPLSLVNAAVALIPPEAQAEIHDEMEVAFDDLHMSWSDLRNLWEEVREAPEATFVTVQSRDETVVVRKEGSYLLVETAEANDRGAQVDVKFPLAVVDALLSGPDNTLDFQAALRVLADQGHGHLVSVRDGDETVKIWIDDIAEAE